MSLAQTKAERRRQIRDTLSALPFDRRIELSRLVCDQLTLDERCRSVQAAMGYLALPSEVNLDELLARWIHEGRCVSAPRVDWGAGLMIPTRLIDLDNSLETRQRQVREPSAGEAISLEKIDLVLVPGLAFDRHARRLGRGGGFYDRFLADLRRVSGAWIVGVAFDEQITADLPMEEHDIAMDAVVTPTRWIRPDTGSMSS